MGVFGPAISKERMMTHLAGKKAVVLGAAARMGSGGTIAR
jgi:hypothetical protein